LVRNLEKESLPITEGEILDAILKLQSQGKIKLESQPPSASPKLATYLKPVKPSGTGRP
jgi:hypothetical protein